MSRDGAPMTYLPADDSALLIDVLRDYKGEACLEIGFGSGAVISSLTERFSVAVATDLAAPQGETDAKGLFLADRASCFRDRVFDLVAFNPPYLPSEGIDDRAVDGGAGGVEVPMRFLDDALRVLRSDGKILVLLSDSGDVQRFLAHATRLGLSAKERRRKRLFYETLLVFELSRRD
ncbi:MAG: hypothetical protein OK456_01855 [Thaumarchaeota archaeon]|nr:hypothetical protein [Nitrososphaerota archaeon]